LEKKVNGIIGLFDMPLTFLEKHIRAGFDLSKASADIFTCL